MTHFGIVSLRFQYIHPFAALGRELWPRPSRHLLQVADLEEKIGSKN